MSSLKIEYKNISELLPYEHNARTHSKEQIAQIARSIKEFGWTNPILLDGASGIIAGHGRLEAAKILGLDKVPCIELSHLTPIQKKAYIIADNKLALNADWNIDFLASELEELKNDDFDLSLTGFNDDELKDLGCSSPLSEEHMQHNIDSLEFFIAVKTVDESAQEKLFSELKARGYECKIMS